MYKNKIKSKDKILLIIVLSILFILNPSLKKEEIKLINASYKGKEGISQNTLLLKTLGMKKVGASLIWINQVLTVGGDVSPKETIKEIKNNSDKISYLNPYFITNYTFSGSILGLIRIYSRFDLASDIFIKGMKYNPDNKYLKNYYGGIIASSKNDIDLILENFEEIVNNTKDDLLLSLIASIYEKKYKESKNQDFLKKSIKYWRMLLNSKESNYVELGRRKIKEYSEF